MRVRVKHGGNVSAIRAAERPGGVVTSLALVGSDELLRADRLGAGYNVIVGFGNHTRDWRQRAHTLGGEISAQFRRELLRERLFLKRVLVTQIVR